MINRVRVELITTVQKSIVRWPEKNKSSTLKRIIRECGARFKMGDLIREILHNLQLRKSAPSQQLLRKMEKNKIEL